MTNWNLKLLYSSPTDPRIEADVKKAEKMWSVFAKKYDIVKKTYLNDADALLKVLTEYEQLLTTTMWKSMLYFYFTRDLDGNNKIASSQIPLLESRAAHLNNKTIFFEVTLGKIPVQTQRKLLKDPRLSHFKVFLQRTFEDGKYTLSVPEEKIMSLKSIPAHNMWLTGNEKLLNTKSVTWKGKVLPLPQANNMIRELPSVAERKRLSQLVSAELKSVAPFSEAEINAVYTNKKINDELRGYSKPYEATVQGYRNDPKVVEQLVKIVTDHFGLAHRFYKIKAQLHKQKKLGYSDRNTRIGKTKSKFRFDISADILENTFEKINPHFSDILKQFIENGQIDAFPRTGKKGGAYCWGSFATPTFVLLNHTDDLDSLRTFAHEMGHAFHSELSRAEGPLYDDYSFSLAETASTLFEAIAMEAVLGKLSKKEKIIVLHDKIMDSVQTILRQIACFNFELELHNNIRSKGFLGHEEIADLHNKHMQAYLGPSFKLHLDDGYMFVQWSHIRRFFYVYSYAYGMLVSKAMLRRYKKDPQFWQSIEQFLKAGGKDSPENILKEIGIDVADPKFWKEGLQEIADDVDRLEKLTRTGKK